MAHVSASGKAVTAQATYSALHAPTCRRSDAGCALIALSNKGNAPYLFGGTRVSRGDHRDVACVCTSSPT